MTDALRGLLHGSEWRHAALRLLRAPGFSCTVAALLSLALAATLTLAAAASALLLRPLPYPAGERLVEVAGHSGAMGFSMGFAPGLLPVLDAMPEVSKVLVWAHARAVEGAAGSLLRSAQAAPGTLESLGARALHGRLLQAGDAGTDAVVLSEATWRARHGADPTVVGRRIAFGALEFRVVGIVAAPFRFPDRGTALWRPLDLRAAREQAPFDWGRVQVLVERSAGVSLAALRQALDARILPLPEVAPMREHMQLEIRAEPLRERWVGQLRAPLALAGAAVLLVLALLTANLAGLWLERALRRRRELAIRGALGASSARIAAGLAAESLLLCGAALVLALALVPAGLSALAWLGLLDGRLPWEVAPDWRVLLAGGALGTALASLLALVPLAVARRTGAPDLAGGARTLSLGPASERLRHALVVLQVALAVTLLAGGALLGRSLLSLLDQDPGFRAEGLVMVQVEPALHRDELDPGALAALHAHAAGLPGVVAIAYSNSAPFSHSEVVSTFADPDRPDSPVSARDRMVDSGWFATLRQPLLRGRGFLPADADAPAVVVDERFARQLFGHSDVVGKRIGLPAGEGEPFQPAEIVGVAASVLHDRLDEAPGQGTVYRAVAAPSFWHRSLLLRTEGPLGGLGDALRAAAPPLGLRIAELQTARAALAASVADRRPLIGIALGFALVGTLLAAVGLFALVAFAVERRAGEFGLRLAVGASPAALGRLALRDAARIALPGLALGLAGALLAGQLLAARLHGVAPYDPATLAAVLTAVAACLLAAATWPARRAARLDPTLSLRCD